MSVSWDVGTQLSSLHHTTLLARESPRPCWAGLGWAVRTTHDQLVELALVAAQRGHGVRLRLGHSLQASPHRLRQPAAAAVGGLGLSARREPQGR